MIDLPFPHRLLRDPKPLVVGIAWVVECVEKMTHIDESKFLVDLDGVNVSGTNKVVPCPFLVIIMIWSQQVDFLAPTFHVAEVDIWLV